MWNDAQLDLTFGALADPTRRAILARLAQGEASVAELAEPFTLSVRAISKHIAVLEEAKLISRGKDGQKRPSRIEPDRLVEVDEWLEHYRSLWEDRFDRLEEAIARRKAENPK